MTNRDVIAIGASRGGVDALRFLVSQMPAGWPASVLITLHLSDRFPSYLDQILGAAGPLPTQFAADGAELKKGAIYVAPPERHLLLEGDRLALGSGPRENFARPAIDPMMRSVAVCCGYRAVGVVLTGELMDGAAGLAALKQCGGVTVTQEPAEAECAGMPNAAVETKPDHIVRLADMPQLLEALIQQPAEAPSPAPQLLKLEVNIAKDGHATIEDMDGVGARSTLTCPDCGGPLWELGTESDALRYRCHIGHGYKAELLDLTLDSEIRRALGAALRTLTERIALVQELQKEAAAQARKLSADLWAEKIKELNKEKETIINAVALTESLRAQYLRKRRSEDDFPEENRRPARARDRH